MDTRVFDQQERAQAYATILTCADEQTLLYVEALEAVALAAKKFWGNTIDTNADALYAALERVGWMEEDWINP